MKKSNKKLDPSLENLNKIKEYLKDVTSIVSKLNKINPKNIKEIKGLEKEVKDIAKNVNKNFKNSL